MSNVKTTDFQVRAPMASQAQVKVSDWNTQYTSKVIVPIPHKCPAVIDKSSPPQHKLNQFRSGGGA